jgi:hypothetical protein
MNQREFSELVTSALNGELLTGANLDDISKKYPYCQTGQILRYLMLLQNNNILHFQQLRVASAYSGERKKLKTLHAIYHNLQKSNSKGHSHFSTSDDLNQIPQIAEVPDKTSSDGISDESQKEPETKPQISTDQSSETPETSLPSEKPKAAESIGPKETKAKPTIVNQRTKQELIDQFIKNSPRISRSKTDFYDPEDYSKNSQIDQENIVSETLATIYFKQGNYAKAISTYQKLILKVPQKSSFFAAQIKKIKEVQNLNN